MSAFQKFMSSFEALSASGIVLFIGCIAWMTELHLTTSASAEAISKMQTSVQEMQLKIEQDKVGAAKEIYQQLQEMNQRLSRIEGKLQ